DVHPAGRTSFRNRTARVPRLRSCLPRDRAGTAGRSAPVAGKRRKESVDRVGGSTPVANHCSFVSADRLGKRWLVVPVRWRTCIEPHPGLSWGNRLFGGV